jgi:hypothetical protein
LGRRGEVLVIGPGTAWSSVDPKNQGQALKIAARVLQTTS